MAAAQRLEQDVENFAWALLKRSGEADRKERDWLEGRTLGEIWKRVERICRETDDVWTGNVRVFVRFRNYLTHHFFLDAFKAGESEEQCAAALTYLDEFDDACVVAGYHLRLLIDALGVSGAARFPISVERGLAERRGIDADTAISFRRL